MKTWAAALSFALVLNVGNALAGSLINKDSERYDYRISCGGGTTSTYIGSNTTQSGALRKGCKIELKNGEKYEVKGDEDVVIKKGKMEGD